MKPIEAVAWAIADIDARQSAQSDVADILYASRRGHYRLQARAAILTLADNVSEKMRNQLEDRRHDLAAAIRSAADET